MMRMERTVTLGWMSGWSGKRKVHMVVLVEVRSGNGGSAGPGGGFVGSGVAKMWSCVYVCVRVCVCVCVSVCVCVHVSVHL